MEKHQNKKSPYVSMIVRIITQKPLLCILTSVILVLALLPGLLQFETQNNVRIWFRETDPNVKTLDYFERQFGNDENLAVAIHSPKGVFRPPILKALKEITEKMWLLPQVIRIDSLTNYNLIHAEDDDIIIEPLFPDGVDHLERSEIEKLRDKALNHRVLPGYLVSSDGKTAIIFARLAPSFEGAPDYAQINKETLKLLKDYKNIDDLQYYVSGEAAINYAFKDISYSDIKNILPILFLLIIMYLYWIFRNIIAVCLPLIVTIFSVAGTLGFNFYVGHKFNSILSILPAILIAISIADSVHLLITFFQRRGEGKNKPEALTLTIEKNLVPTFLTTISTMIGFFSLALAELLPIRQLGVMAGFGCLLAWIVSIFFVCPLLLFVNFKIPQLYQKSRDPRGTTPFSFNATKIIWRFRFPIIVLSTLFTIGSIYIGSKNIINSDPYGYFSKKTFIRKSNDFILSHYGGNSGPEFVIRTGIKDGIKNPQFLKKVSQLKTFIESYPFVNKTIDITDIVKDMNQALHGGDPSHFKLPKTQNEVGQQIFLYTMGLPQGMDLNNRMSLDFESMRLSVLWTIKDSKRWSQYVHAIEEKAKQLDLNLITTGKTNLFQRMMGYVVKTFFESISMALILVSLLMMIIFRSITLGLFSLVPNVLPLIFGAAFMKITNMELNIGTTLVASVCLGIAVDDTIHFLSNYNANKLKGMPTLENIASVFSYTGSALVMTTIILVSGFGLYVLGDFVPNVNFGLLSAMVLSAALIVDLVILPALLLLKVKKID